MSELDYSEVAMEANQIALKLYDALMLEMCKGPVEIVAVGPDADQNERVRIILDHIKNSTDPGPTANELMKKKLMDKLAGKS